MKDTSTPDSRTSSSARFSLLSNRSTLWLAGAAMLLLLLALTINVWLLAEQLQQMAHNDQQQAFWSLCHAGTTAEDRARSFLMLAAAGNTEWRSAMLSELDLDAADLAGLSLQKAGLSSGSFQKARFSGADLTGARLDLSDFSDAHFDDCRLRNATLFKARLNNADFRSADLLSASLEQCVAQRASFVAAKMGDAFLAMGDFSEANFTGAELSGANLEAAIFRNADVALANFENARLVDTDFTDTNWWRCRGLTSQQLDDYTLAFAPTPNASESRRRDFEIWLARRMQELSELEN